jgi:hypothetical protein
MVSQIRTIFSNRWYLAQFFLVIAGASGWNILGLATLLERHKYLRTIDWLAIVLIAGAVVFIAILGWIWAIISYRKPEIAYDNPKRLGLKIALWSGGAAFLLGWFIFIWLMLGLMNNEPWCLTGVLGAMLEDWLPNGIKITVLIIVISLLTSRWFLWSNPEPQDMNDFVAED